MSPPVRDRFTLTPAAYRRVALAALASLVLIVFTGAAVRLTGSGLGCPDWPRCGDGYIAPLQTHAVIEFGNRVFSGIVVLATLAAGLLAWRRRPYRRDIAVLGALLPLGVVGQAVLGGLTVEFGLKPGFVMAHFGLSMLILVAAVALAWRASYEPGERPLRTDRASVWAVRGLLPLGALTIFVGTAATAAGPHAGGAGTGDVVSRLYFKGPTTLDWTIHQHARLAMVLGLAAVVVWLVLWRRAADPQARGAVGALIVILGLQGVVGTVQYKLLNLPSEIVWVHVVLASLAWVSLLWAVAASGRLAPKAAPAAEQAEPERVERLEPAGAGR
jgi:cytochrome c oxidase assembly protein subunit 15